MTETPIIYKNLADLAQARGRFMDEQEIEAAKEALRKARLDLSDVLSGANNAQSAFDSFRSTILGDEQLVTNAIINPQLFGDVIELIHRVGEYSADKEYGEELRHLHHSLISLLDKNTPYVLKNLHEMDPDEAVACMYYLSETFDTTEVKKRFGSSEIYKRFLAMHGSVAQSLDLFKGANREADILEILRHMYSMAEGELKASIMEAIAHHMQTAVLTTKGDSSTFNDSQLNYLLNRWLTGMGEQQFGIKVVEKILNLMDLDGTALTTAWEKSYIPSADDLPQERIQRWVQKGMWYRRNFNQVLSLYQHDPETVKNLMNQFGLRDFARYPLDMLIAQADKKNWRSKRYGIVLNSYEDHNGALNKPELYKFIQEHPDFMLYFFETDNIEHFGLDNLRKAAAWLKWQTRRKAAFLITGEHGGPTRIDNHTKITSLLSKLGVEILKHPDMQELYDFAGSFFEEGAPIVLQSCYANRDGGVGDILHQRTGLTVIGSDGPYSIDSIDLSSIEDGPVSLRVRPSIRANGTRPFIINRGKKKSPLAEAV